MVRILLLLVSIVSGFTHAKVELQGELTQGGLIRGKIPAGGRLLLNDTPLKVAPTGEFVFGFGRDEELEHVLTHVSEDGAQSIQTIKLKPRTYDIQRIEGVEQKYVSPPESVLSRIRKDNQMVAGARKTNDPRLDFMQAFIWPAKGPITGVYGSQRVFNGEPKRPHFGVDVAGPVGTQVVAPADGIVTLFVPDMYYSGGTMIIDHGYGVSSTFLHLSKSLVTQGTVVKQGEPVAEIGATGRVTGAHLDWRVNWFNVRLDPALLVSQPE